MNPMRFEIRPAANSGKPGFRVHYTDAKNGKTILWSEVYDDRRAAYKAITLTKQWARTAPIQDQILGMIRLVRKRLAG